MAQKEYIENWRGQIEYMPKYVEMIILADEDLKIMKKILRPNYTSVICNHWIINKNH